jgi:WD40 repeat protein
VWNLTAIFNKSSSGAPPPLTLKCQFGKVFGVNYIESAQNLITGSDDGLINIYSIDKGTSKYGSLLTSYNSDQVVNFVIIANITENGRIIVVNMASMKV